ncbi:proton pump-interactor 1-like [Arachis stenosperma]|uniref:proton pump-interactor 1-like n=1 Tax=Arachis stenosperma TaxID=217475 RepID=UPI0025AC3D14|nr:proton pump-interactor 1-like [Arachis stenosperma]
MAVEVVGFEMVQGPMDTGAEGGKPILNEKEHGKLEKDSSAAIKFGSHGDESAKGEGNKVSDSSVPKEAAEEWPAPKQIHSFYFVRCRPYEDPHIKSKIDQLDKEITKKNQARYQVTEALKAKRSERAELISQIKALRGDSRQFQSIVDEKIKEIEPLQQALGKLRTNNNAGRSGLCSSEEELNDIIYSLQYRIQHESISLNEEKQIMREIKQLEGTREKVVANAAMRAKLQDSMGQKEAIQDQVKAIGGDLDGVKKERQAIRSKIKQIDDELKVIDKDIQTLQDELTAITQKREQAYESIQQLRKKRDEGNSHFHQSRIILNKAKELAAKKDVSAIEELSQTEVEKFMSHWNSDKAFRNDYEKRILPSLDMRQLSRDGRMRNPDEKPILEEPKVAETVAPAKAVAKQPKEEPKPAPQETLVTQAVPKEAKNKGKDSKSKLAKDIEETDEYDFAIPVKETPKEPKVDPAKLKEIKREEEIAKAKQALERKKKLAEKAAAKAAIKAQKEAEKKLKDREKKAAKKKGLAATDANPEEQPEDSAAVEATEQEKEDNVEAPAPVAVKEKALKESSVRSRSRAAKGPELIPKAILKRKKSTNNNMLYASIAAFVLAVLVLLIIAYIYLI